MCVCVCVYTCASVCIQATCGPLLCAILLCSAFWGNMFKRIWRMQTPCCCCCCHAPSLPATASVATLTSFLCRLLLLFSVLYWIFINCKFVITNALYLNLYAALPVSATALAPCICYTSVSVSVTRMYIICAWLPLGCTTAVYGKLNNANERIENNSNHNSNNSDSHNKCCRPFFGFRNCCCNCCGFDLQQCVN